MALESLMAKDPIKKAGAKKAAATGCCEEVTS